MTSTTDWKQVLASRLPLLGHRNWIVVADSAYPAQSRAGIETIVAEGDQLDVVRTVMAAVSASEHVKPVVYTDQELAFVAEQDAPGVSSYRERLGGLLNDFGANTIPHEEIISKLDQAAQLFNILIIKTRMTIPYTSVFLALDCAYWNGEAEARLRSAMRTGAGKQK